MRKQRLTTSLTQRVKIGRSQKEQELVAQRLKTMECYNSIFVEPMPKYDQEKDVSWEEIAAIIFKAAEKEKNVAENPELRPEQALHAPYELMKNCVDCCKYLLEDM